MKVMGWIGWAIGALLGVALVVALQRTNPSLAETIIFIEAFIGLLYLHSIRELLLKQRMEKEVDDLKAESKEFIQARNP